MSERKVKLVCPYCGSDDIIRDGPLTWDIEAQGWKSCGDMYDDMSCEACGEYFKECNEVEVNPTLPPTPQP